MNPKTRLLWMESIVGLMGFALLAALFVLTVILSSEDLFHRPMSMRAVFDDVMGLRVGDNVVSRGMTIGKVKAIAFGEEGVVVTADLDQHIVFRDDYKIVVEPSSLLGGRNLSVDAGRNGAVLPADAKLEGHAPQDLIVSATEAIGELRAALNGGIIDDVKASLSNIRKITEDLQEGKGTIGMLLKDEESAGKLRGTLAKIADIGDKIASGEGTLGKLIYDGTVYDDVQAIAANLKGVSETLARGEGTLGKLLSENSTMYDDLAGAIKSFREVGEGLARGDGALGKLLTDDALYDDLRAILAEGSATLDDLRETSPITTFSSVLFGIW
jgi:phospholipid/cholesterol/gamma-HCH transport system substrate-binding protein